MYTYCFIAILISVARERYPAQKSGSELAEIGALGISQPTFSEVGIGIRKADFIFLD
jgi:hypothetical protein